MPISSRASQNYLQILCRLKFPAHLHVRTFAAQPDSHSRLSASGVKKAFRTTVVKKQLKKQALNHKESQDDPEAIERMNEMFAQQGGIDRWAHMDVDILGAFSYSTWLSTPFIWYPTLIHLRELDVELPIRNDLPWGFNKIKYTFDNSLNTVKSAAGYVSFCHLLQFFLNFFNSHQAHIVS
jgi:hypothetical protein